jgi:hypothetical protein
MDGMPKHSNRIDGDQMRRAAMWALASGVAAIAATVSYSHIYDLGRAHGGTGVPARLLPLSVDMLILVGELMLLHEADTKGRRFILGWVLVWSGILATLAANVTFGAQFGVVGAVIWGWPAYSFILAAAGMVSVVKRQERPVTVVIAEPGEMAGEVAPEIAPEITTEPATEVPAEDSPVITTEATVMTAPDITPEITTEVISAVVPEVTTRRRRVVPAKATDDDLAVIILDATDDPATLTSYKVNKAIKDACGGKGVGEARAVRLVDLAQRRHRSRSVVSIGDRR